MESTIFKITLSNKYSGIFYGPMTIIYGLGIILIELLNNYLFNKIRLNKYVKLFLEYLILLITLSLLEYITGNIIYLIFHIDMWNYSTSAYHLGKYLCLRNSLIWALLGILYLSIFKPFTDKIVNAFTIKETKIFLLIFIIDTLMVVITKI